MEIPEQPLTSRQNPLVMLAASLTERRERERTGLFRFDGRKLFLEALAAGLPLAAVLLRASSAGAVAAGTAGRELPADCRVACLSDSLFDRISEEKSPDGVICLSKRLDKIHKIVTIEERDALPGLLLPGRALLLESVRDPGNVGTIVRSARAFGCPNLLLSADCADLYHPRVLRAAMGALFAQRVLVVADAVDAAVRLGRRGRVYAASLDGPHEDAGTVAFGREDCVVVGNEGHGISPALLAACGARVRIPMEPGVESLNAGVAASLLLWEFYRGR